MFDGSFFTSKVGHAALVSVVAMIAFTVFAQIQQDVAGADTMLSATASVALA
ncbi:hypothetical protein [Aurantiacibacter aquimixticola]|uniref:hypothetical protein n=1 Tax=Aurantiacibacter aquimixticola TaxID=1958945 RepID=UPI001401CB06|nr:hypothetical protein [Aurantiacibacter aquimixticola]